MPTKQPQLDRITAYLTARREALLDNWRTACEADPDMHSAATLSRQEFNDMVPVLLTTLQERLLSNTDTTDAISIAAEHGLHRWHKGYSLQELLKEIEHLRVGLLSEIGYYWQYYPQVANPVIQQAYEQVSRLCGEAVRGSVLKYDELKATSAVERVNSLQAALTQLNQLEQQRSSLLRMTTHDLRGGLSIVSGAASLMNMPSTSDEGREQFLDMMQRNLSNVQRLLEKLSDLAQLEAGQDKIEVSSFDASELLRSLVESAQPIATERGLLLQADGPASLPVEGDRLKVQRIVQNLLLNALRYTPSDPDQPGWVSVSWTIENDYRWFVSIQDTGPGLPEGPASQLAVTLMPPDEPTSIYQEQKENQPAIPPSIPAMEGGEGLGLHIVKRLCELVHANLDVEIKPGVGTLFRVQLSRHWL